VGNWGEESRSVRELADEAPVIRNERELEVWRNAVTAAMAIYRASASFPKEERYSLTDQIRRSSCSVAAHVAEAWRKRRYEAAFVSKLNNAEGEAAETQTWIEFAKRRGYWNEEFCANLSADYDHVLGQLVSMITRSNEWCSGLSKP
jgi:four helix bundle protein